MDPVRELFERTMELTEHFRRIELVRALQRNFEELPNGDLRIKRPPPFEAK